MFNWFARRTIGDRPAIVLQHEHFTGTGDTTQSHFRTTVAWPMPSTKPDMWLRRPRVGVYPLTGTAEVPDVQIGDAAFDKAFLIQCPADATAPPRLLTRDVRTFILAGPKQESWSLSRGYACCSFYADVSPDGLRAMLRRTRAMAEMWSRE
jgi:hypothetical protein